MTVDALLLAYADTRHRALVAAHDGHKGFAWALNLEADRMAARLRKLVGK